MAERMDVSEGLKSGRRRRRASRVVGLVVLVIATTGPACGGGGSAGKVAAQEMSGVRSAARTILGLADEVVRGGRPAEEVAPQLSKHVDELSEFGKRLTPEDRNLLTALQGRGRAVFEIMDARAAADAAVTFADAEAVRVARSNMRGRVMPFAADLEAVTKDVAKSTGCDLVANALLPEEHDELGTEATQAPLSKKIEDAAIKRLQARYSVPAMRRLVAWNGWATGVLSVAKRMAEAPPGTIESAVGVHSRAYYYFLKACHAPPR